MTYFTRKQIIEILEIEDAFFIQLEQEEIVQIDEAQASSEACYSEIMLERVRVADTLVHELDVNLAGAAVIVQMRENLADLRHRLEEALAELRRHQR
jgi:hypothetical protein